MKNRATIVNLIGVGLALFFFSQSTPAIATTTNYRSIGTHNGVLFDCGTASVTEGSTMVTIDGCDILDLIGRGDKITIENEKYYILDINSGSQLTLQSGATQSFQNASFSIQRAYNSLRSWERDRDGDLVGEDRLEVGICYDDGSFTSDRRRWTLVTIDGSLTDPEHFMWLTVAEKHRHDGTAGTGVVLDGNNKTKFGIRVRDDYTRIEWLEMVRFGHRHGAAAVLVKNAQNVTLNQLIIHDFKSKYYNRSGIKGGRYSSFIARNCVIYNGGFAGIKTNHRSSQATIENCTINGMAGFGVFERRGSMAVTNTISMKNSHGDFQIKKGHQSHNLSSDDTAGGAYSLIRSDPQTQFVSITEGEENFHLTEASDAVDSGTDLSQSFQVDIDGHNRSAGKDWDMGADELEVETSRVWFVAENGSGDGTTWDNAAATIQEAVSAARPGDEIWVQAGRYTVSKAISISNAVALYGGFAGNETRRDERDLGRGMTIIDGSSRSRCLSLSADGIVLDGFVIQNGNDNMYGGALYADGSQNIVIANCRFINNVARTKGGAIYADLAPLTLRNCVFSQNTAGFPGPGNGGGAIYNSGSDSEIINCTFVGNSSVISDGGAIYNADSKPIITNGLFWENISKGKVNHIYDDFNSNSNVTYCFIDQAEFLGSGSENIQTVLQIAPLDADFHLVKNSICIDKGNKEVEGLPEIDFEGDVRINGDGIDIGADEF